ncbi:hypothetical protein E1301_Tti020885 [Triplophysa tibetana]|uniref:Immunoglobulin domain-containing protein n=1 Tax=Triplophysa tibetana TaxID=1572043 RepID=A0A5A9NQL3_9TELE|nr:hypothetical protein E1301_Tti020885 [Triplophysa tibetana]
MGRSKKLTRCYKQTTLKVAQYQRHHHLSNFIRNVFPGGGASFGHACMEHVKAEAASSDVIEVCCAEVDGLLCCTVTLHITDDLSNRKHFHINSSEVNTMDVHTYLCLSLLIVMGVFGDADEVKSVSVMEGDSVTLNTDTELHGEDEIRLWWSFGPQNIVLAKIDRKDKSIKLPNDEIFQDRLKMNDQTGDLTITNITSQHSGLYTLMIRRNMKVSNKTFSVTVSARLSVPNTYRCVVNNPITNLTQHLHITQLCHPSSVSSDPSTTEVNIIPVVFALVICVVFIIIIISVYMHKRKHYNGLIKTSDGEVPQTDEESSIDSSSTSDGGVL